MFIVRWFFGLVLLALLVLGVMYYSAGRRPGPAVTITAPPVVGQTAPLEVAVEAPGGVLDALTVQIDQKGQSFSIFGPGTSSAPLKKDGDRILLAQSIGKSSVPQLQPGPATIVVNATRPVLRGLRH